jgi:hypothetical protein
VNPRERQLTRRAALLVCDLLELLVQLDVGLHVFRLKTRVVHAPVARLEGGLASKEAAAEGAVRDDADAELPVAKYQTFSRQHRGKPVIGFLYKKLSSSQIVVSPLEFPADGSARDDLDLELPFVRWRTTRHIEGFISRFVPDHFLLE